MMGTHANVYFKCNSHGNESASTAYGTIHDHDVLSGRGVCFSQHPGNERFRTLISTAYRDKSYCHTYSAEEKKALGEEIIAHIENLKPPGRFLKRDSSCTKYKKLEGPWRLLSKKEALKKTTQALRDCNRTDRSEYADKVLAPSDVTAVKVTNLSKERAQAAIETFSKEKLSEKFKNSDPYNRSCANGVMTVPLPYDPLQFPFLVELYRAKKPYQNFGVPSALGTYPTLNSKRPQHFQSLPAMEFFKQWRGAGAKPSSYQAEQIKAYLHR